MIQYDLLTREPAEKRKRTCHRTPDRLDAIRQLHGVDETCKVRCLDKDGAVLKVMRVAESGFTVDWDGVNDTYFWPDRGVKWTKEEGDEQ